MSGRYLFALSVGWRRIVYGVRAWFIDPASEDVRCVMGGSVHAAMRCPRYADIRWGIWCRKHYPGPGWWDR